MPDDSYYPDEGHEGMEGSERGEHTGMGETTLIPKSMFEGKELKAGDEFYFTVVRVHEDEVEVEYKNDEKGESEKGEAEEGHEGAFDRMMGGGIGGAAMGGY